MTPDLVIENGAGWLRLRLLPETQTAVTRVNIGVDRYGQGPVINNARDLTAFGDTIRDWCHTVARELHPGAPLPEDPQGELFEGAERVG